MKTSLSRSRSSEAGLAFLSVLMILLVVCAVVVGVSRFVMKQRARAMRYSAQDRAAGQVEGILVDLRSAIRAQLSTSVASGVPFTLSQVAQGFETSYYSVSMSLQRGDGSPTIPIFPPAGTVAALADDDDPFRGVPAIALPMVAVAMGTPKLPDNQELTAANTVPFEATASLSHRYLPASAWSIFSWGGDLVFGPGIDLTASGSPIDAGRVYSRFDVRVDNDTSLLTQLPIVAGGAVQTQRSGQIEVRPPNGAAVVLEGGQTTANPERILATLAAGGGPIVTGEQTATALMRPSSDIISGTGPTQYTLVDNNGTLIWYNSNGDVVAAPCAAASYYETPRHLNSRIVRLQADLLTVESLRVASADSSAVLLVTNAERLPGQLSIVSSVPVLLAGGFNSTETKAASIISSRQLATVPPWW